jgi:hypothetical protein
LAVFAEEWRACLREQYKYVVRSNDARTLETLTGVMHEVGFMDDELQELQVQATMRADEMPEDYQPDLDILEPTVYPAVAVEEAPGDDDEAEAALTAADLLAMEAEIEAQQATIDTDDEADTDDAETDDDETASAADADSDSPPDEAAPMQLDLFG